MFSFLNKKLDLTEIVSYWNWFAENEKWIIDNCDVKSSEVVYAIDEQLKLVFPNFKGELEFDFAYFNGKGDFNFYDLNKKYLFKVAIILRDNMPANISERWTFNISN